jgi:hypothetical protein
VADIVGVPVTFHRYRVMFSDGDVRDYLAVRDDSDVRAWWVEHHFGYKSTDASAKKHPADLIEGVADMGEELTYTPTKEEADGV